MEGVAIKKVGIRVASSHLGQYSIAKTRNQSERSKKFLLLFLKKEKETLYLKKNYKTRE